MTVETVSDMVAARVREVRKRRGWQPVDLAVRCAGIGAGHLTENVIENIESRSRRGGTRRPRPVTADDLLALSLALNVAAVDLLVPPDSGSQPYPVTATVSEPAFRVRGWICGTVEGSLMRGVDRLAYLSQRPGSVAARLRVTEEGEDDGQHH